VFDFDEEIDRHGDGSVKWNHFGPDILPLFIADMDFRAPQVIIEKLVEKARFGVYGYQLYDELNKLIARWLRRQYKCEADEQWIVLLHALVPGLALTTSMREGSVLIPVPSYTGILDAPVKTGRRSIWSPLKNEDEYYQPDFDDMRHKAEADTRMMMLSNPHNPVGRVYKEEELREFSRFAKERNILVISDEVHSDFIYENKHIPFFTLDDYAYNNSITLMGPGKTYNVAGLPFGFAVIPNKNIRREFKKAAYAISESGVMHAAVAEKAYDGSCDDWKRELMVYLKGNRDFLEAGLKKISSDIKFPHNEGSYLQWIDFSRLLGEENPYRWLIKKARVAMSEGAAFGESDANGRRNNHVRLNFATTRARLAEALRRIEAALNA
jgi:cystathionine beta-lyase